MYRWFVFRVSGLDGFMKYKNLSFLKASSSNVTRFALGLALLSSVALFAPAHAQSDNPFETTETTEAVDGGASTEAVETSGEGVAPEVTEGSGLPEAATGETSDPFGFSDDGMEVEKTADQIEGDFRKEAFDQALRQMLPLNPDEIRELLEHFDRTKESSQLPVHPYPRAESVVQNVSLDPGSTPVVIKLAHGYVTTLSLLDGSGAPWPIKDMSWVGDFEIMDESKETKQPSHLLRISPGSEFAHGNISIRLFGLDTPVVMTFETNRDMVYYRMDAIVPGSGPNVQTPLIDKGITFSAGDPDMSVALSGVMPQGAKAMNVNGADGRTSAYFYNGLTYVRTPLTLLSPGWESSVTSTDGTRVYALEEAPVLLLSDKGRMVRVHLSPREELLNE